MPIPTPSKNEDKNTFVSRCMSSEVMKKEYPKQDQRSAICYSQFKKGFSKGKEMLCLRGLKKKEDGVYTGLVATSHPDRVGDILSTTALTQIADWINSSNTVGGDSGSYRSLSLFHDWVHSKDPTMDEAGFMRNARVIELADGHKGVEVEIEVNKYYSEEKDGKAYDKDRIAYEIEMGKIGGLSIEYNEGSSKEVEYNGQTYNYIDSLSEFAGAGFARSRLIANPYAVIYKEIESIVSKKADTPKEVKSKMTEEEKKPEPTDTPVEPAKEEPKVPEEDKKEETPKEPEAKEKAVNETAVKELITKQVKEAFDKMEIKSKPLKSPELDGMELSIKEMNEHIKKGDVDSFNGMVKEMIGQRVMDIATGREPGYYHINKEGDYLGGDLKIKCVGKGLKITGGLKLKGTLDTGINTSSYTQSSVEFADLFAPGIIDTFNNQTNFFGYLRKEQHIGGYFYQWKIVTNKDPDSNGTFVDRDDTTVLKNYSNKINLQTPIKVARRGVSVADFANRYSARSLGDLFQLEVNLQMAELMNDVDAALFAETADGTGNDPLGLEAVADSAGNTTLYGLTRSTTNRLSPDTATDTYQAIGGSLVEATLRGKIDNLLIAGTESANIAILAHPTTKTYLFNLQDTNRRFPDTTAAFGFSQMSVPTFDGYPIIVDHNCNSDAIYIIDTSKDVIVMAMEPRIVSLAKVGAATEGYIEMHFAHVYKEPRKITMMDTLNGPTS